MVLDANLFMNQELWNKFKDIHSSKNIYFQWMKKKLKKKK
jgi:hypothetical protein